MSGKLLTGSSLPQEVLDLLQGWGLPKHLKRLTLSIDAEELVEITCTYYPELPNGTLAMDSNNALEIVTRRYHLIETEE
jgi:hypothetical protein